MEKCFDIRANMKDAEDDSIIYHHSMVLMPCRITITKTKEYKDGSKSYLLFGAFMNATSKEQPSLGQIRAKTYNEALEIAQQILFNNLKDFYDNIGE